MIGRVLAIFVLIAAPAFAQPAPSPPAAPAPDRTTSHKLTLPGRTIEFEAQVATMRLSNPQGALQAEVVTTSFSLPGSLPGADPARRPVTFAINGGPGASSAWLNLG